MTILKRWVLLFLVVMGLSLQGCVSGGIGFNSYINGAKDYQFLYPNSWVKVAVSGSASDRADVVFHDLIEPSENVSVIISQVPEGKRLQDLGTPTEVGQALIERALGAQAGHADRQVELVWAEAKEKGENTYYILEYAAKIGDRERHNLASVVINHNQLLTFNASTPERRWSKVEKSFRTIVDSFSVSS